MSNDNTGMLVLTILGYAYFIASQVFAMYFWWDWAKEHDFLSSIFVGPIVGEFKGLLWIFFI